MANDICSRVGERIRELRGAKGWTQQMLADHSGVERAHLTKLEEGKREAGLRTLEKIAVALDVEPFELLR